MQTKGLIRTSIILVAIFLTYLGLIFPNALAEVELDGEDGVWLDNFEDLSGVYPTNCSYDQESLCTDSRNSHLRTA